METTANAQLAAVKRVEKVSLGPTGTAGWELGESASAIHHSPAMEFWQVPEASLHLFSRVLIHEWGLACSRCLISILLY